MTVMITAILLVLIVVLLLFSNLIQRLINQRYHGHRYAPGPMPLPIFGNLHLFRKYQSPFQAFSALAKKYGEMYSITLGTTPCIVINNYSTMHVILNVRMNQFDDRPDFIRFHKLFGGDRGNSLALCDWSDLQRTRRSLAKRYCSPRASLLAERLDTVANLECDIFMDKLSKLDSLKNFELKPLVMALCGNIFCHYMSSVRFEYTDVKFQRTVRLFDEIFWEINQGYAIDFLPWLSPFYKRHLDRLSSWSTEIRQFIMENIVGPHLKEKTWKAPHPKDFTDALLKFLDKDANLTWNHIMYELEDFIGGHSAIGNLIMLALGYIVKNPEVGLKIQEEVDTISMNGQRPFSYKDRRSMPYTEATMWETLRVTSSPIVPHVASEDTNLNGFRIEKGTVVFLNNYGINTSQTFWDEPEKFKPERFITKGQVGKPGFFIPFSSGKRVCIGQKMVQGLTFQILARLLQVYDVGSENISEITHNPACVALPPNTYRLTLTPRVRM